MVLSQKLSQRISQKFWLMFAKVPGIGTFVAHLFSTYDQGGNKHL